MSERRGRKERTRVKLPSLDKSSTNSIPNANAPIAPSSRQQTPLGVKLQTEDRSRMPRQHAVELALRRPESGDTVVRGGGEEGARGRKDDGRDVLSVRHG